MVDYMISKVNKASKSMEWAIKTGKATEIHFLLLQRKLQAGYFDDLINDLELDGMVLIQVCNDDTNGFVLIIDV